MTAPLTIPDARTGLPKSPKIPGGSDIATTGTPIPLGGMGGVPFSGNQGSIYAPPPDAHYGDAYYTPPADATTQPVQQPAMRTNPSTSGGLPDASAMATTDPMAFANTAAPPPATGGPGGGRPGDTPTNPLPTPPAPPRESTGALRMVQYANGVTGAAGSSAGGAANGTKMQDPTTGIYTIAGSPQYYDRNGRPIDATYNGAGLVLGDGSFVRFNPQSIANAAAPRTDTTNANGQTTATWGDVGAGDSRIFSANVTGNDQNIAGGTADFLNTFADVLSPDQLASGKTLGELGVTEQQLIDAGLGYLVNDPSWMNRQAGEQTPFSFSLRPDGQGAREGGWYDGGDSSGTYHPPNEASQLSLVNGNYVNAAGQTIYTADQAPYGIDPMTQTPKAAPPVAVDSGKNPNGARLTDGSTPTSFRPIEEPDPYPWMAPPVPVDQRPGYVPPSGAALAPNTAPNTGAAGSGATGQSGASGAPSSVPTTAPMPLPPGNAGGTPPTGNPAATSTVPLNPDDSLLNKVITPENTIDRFKLAQDKFDAFAKSTDPAYQAALRDTNRYQFGAGRGVSGMAKNSIGDVQTQRDLALDTNRQNFLTDALSDSIEDLYRNLGIEQQQQGFQKSLSDTGFDQSVTQAQLQDALTNSDFGRWLAASGFDRDTQALLFNQAMQKVMANESLTQGAFNRGLASENAGYANNPSDIDLILSQIFGSQASAAGQAAAGSFANAGNKSGSSASSSDAFTRWLMEQIFGNKSGSGAPAGSTNDGGYPVYPE